MAFSPDLSVLIITVNNKISWSPTTVFCNVTTEIQKQIYTEPVFSNCMLSSYPSWLQLDQLIINHRKKFIHMLLRIESKHCFNSSLKAVQFILDLSVWIALIWGYEFHLWGHHSQPVSVQEADMVSVTGHQAVEADLTDGLCHFQYIWH